MSWAAANSVLDYLFLVIPIIATTKSILKKSKTNKKGRALTFGPEYVGVKTCGEHYLTDTTPTISSAKGQKNVKQYEQNHQIFIDITVLGNHFGFNCTTTFLQNLRLNLSVIIGLNAKLVMLPYPDYHTASKGRLV